MSTTATLPTAATTGSPTRLGPPLTLTVIAGCATGLHLAVGWRQAALFLVGTLAGLVLYHAAFGFTSAWRVFISDRRGGGLRAQMLMLAVTCAVFFPLIAQGSVFGQAVRGSVAPAGIPVLAGAFIFGIGMQLGGGCASGTLYSAGGGSTRMLLVLAFFIVGSLVGTAHTTWWNSLPAFAPTSIVSAWGPVAALAASVLVFGLVAVLTRAAERRRHGTVTGIVDAGRAHWLRGPWPLVAGAVGLALVNIATLLLAGRPWGVTSAFALWGAKVAMAMGIGVETWPYWAAPAQARALHASVITDVTSVMNLGIVVGAMLAAFLAGRFAPVWHLPAGSVVAAVIGGLLLGYGARVAYGCNIGAYFSGIASGSLHGWLWLPAAFAGNVLGTHLRPTFGLGVERTPRC